MSGKIEFGRSPSGSTHENIAYIRQMLAELAHVARREKAEMLAYLLEMAFTEASDILNGDSVARKIERDQTAGMPVKPAGKI